MAGDRDGDGPSRVLGQSACERSSIAPSLTLALPVGCLSPTRSRMAAAAVSAPRCPPTAVLPAQGRATGAPQRHPLPFPPKVPASRGLRASRSVGVRIGSRHQLVEQLEHLR